jgi:ATP-dependent DNA helicase RecG
MDLLTPLSSFAQIPRPAIQRLHDAGMNTLWDCISHLPKRYVFIRAYCEKQGLPLSNDPVILSLTIDRSVSCGPWRFLGQTSSESPIELVFFKKPRLSLPKGSRWTAQGPLELGPMGLRMIHPHLRPFKAPPPLLIIEADYSLPKGITSRQFSWWIRGMVQSWSLGISSKAWPSFREALVLAHFPKHKDDTLPTAPWRKRLACDELMAHHIAERLTHQAYTRSVPAQATPSLHKDTSVEEAFLQAFGHPLTSSQQEAWMKIQQDLEQNNPMMRMLHGDVGSGKTLIAFLALLRMLTLHHEGCLLAPTESLARQHFQTFSKLAQDVPIRLILGGGKTEGHPQASLTIGTHALLYERVLFSSLRLIVIDEQQRFGVMQRFQLAQKGNRPHMLFLSATPIPRTFERLLWGHMDVSRLARHACGPSVQTYLIPQHRMPELERWIRRCIQQKEGVYWVCPAIEKEEGGAMMRAAYWQDRLGIPVGCLHSRLNSVEKETTLHAFRTGVVPLLVSTTVIEVGIHVEQASTMIIEDSARFGLSQLHQLRGRVGRGTIPGHCFLLYQEPLSAWASERLTFLRGCTDGFALAEQDWKCRGGGMPLGLKQSGLAKYTFVDFSVHQALLPIAIEKANALWNNPSQQAKATIKALLRLLSIAPTSILQAG